jgi:hypothetical protein
VTGPHVTNLMSLRKRAILRIRVILIARITRALWLVTADTPPLPSQPCRARWLIRLMLNPTRA